MYNFTQSFCLFIRFGNPLHQCQQCHNKFFCMGMGIISDAVPEFFSIINL